MTRNDGLFFSPWTTHDRIVLAMAVLGTAYRIYLSFASENRKNKRIQDVFGIILISTMMTIGVYEIAISLKWKAESFYLIFVIVIITAKDLSDWLFLDKEGKAFVISTFKAIVESFLGKLGYKKDNKNDHRDNHRNQ